MSTHINEHVKDVFEVMNDSSFIEKEFTSEEIEKGDMSLYELPKVKLARKIIAAQIAYWLMRRTNYLCGSTTDNQSALVFELKQEYKKLTGEDFKYNLEVDY